MKTAPSSKLLSALASGLAVAMFVALVHSEGGWEALELRTRDMRMRATVPAREGHPEIGLIMITDDSLLSSHMPWPWPREAFADLYRACARGGAKAILLDFLTLVDKDHYGTESVLADQMKKSPPNYAAVPFIEDKKRKGDTRENLLDRYALRIDTDHSAEPPDDRYNAVLWPQAELADAMTGVCDVSTPRDPLDGHIRRYGLFSKFKGRYYPSMALCALMAREGASSVAVKNRTLAVGRLSIPLEKDAAIHLRYYRPFSYWPASNVMSSLWKLEEEGKIDRFDPAWLNGKAIILGTNAAQLHDIRVVPVGEKGQMAGSEIQATAIANLLSGEYLRETPPALSYALIVCFALASAIITRYASAATGGVAVAVLLGGLTAFNTWLFQERWIVDLVPQLVAILLAYAASSTLNFLYEGRQRLRIKREFQRYLSPKVVEKILKNPDALRMKGERKPLTLFFMDFAGFTSLSETLDPAELVTLVSDYHDAAAQEIFKTEGTVDKYIGDAIMAFWNDPVEQPDHALRGCLAAVGAQRRLRELAGRMRERGLPEMRARIGINTGTSTVGNMGARGQVNYTAMGDEVNLASRLEGVNKEFGTDIIISEATYLPIREKLEVRELALIKVKGRHHPVRIYELLGLKGEVPEERLTDARAFEKGLAAFRERRFTEAWPIFMSAVHRKDRAAEPYLNLCERYGAEGPPPDWDGSYQMETK